MITKFVFNDDDKVSNELNVHRRRVMIVNMFFSFQFLTIKNEQTESIFALKRMLFNRSNVGEHLMMSIKSGYSITRHAFCIN